MFQPLRYVLDDGLDEASGVRIRPVAFVIADDDIPTPVHVQVAGFGSFCLGCRFALGIIPMEGWQDEMRRKAVPPSLIDYLAGELRQASL